MIRRMCQYHGRRESEPARVSRRRIARFSNSCCKSCRRATIPIAAALREQAAGLLAERDAVILHDDLERDNDPQLFHQFLAQPPATDCNILGDAHFGQMFGIGIDTAGLD